MQNLLNSSSSQEFSIGKDIVGTVVFFFSCFYLGYVTSLPASICCSQKTWYFSKLAIKNNWKLYDWARIQYRVSDQSCRKLQLMGVIKQFQKISLPMYPQKASVFHPSVPSSYCPYSKPPSPFYFQFCFNPLEFLVLLLMTFHKRYFTRTSSSYLVMLIIFSQTTVYNSWNWDWSAFMTKCLATKTFSSSVTVFVVITIEIHV